VESIPPSIPPPQFLQFPTTTEIQMPVEPTPAQIQKLLEGPPDQPVVMVNLLRFKPQADGVDEGMTGAEAYGLYAAQMRKVVEAGGGRFVWSGRVDSQVIGDSDDERFDVIGLVEYPSRKGFIEIATSDGAKAIFEHRIAGLESQWLLATTESAL
jgi:uncharacterized protein (DUF1330 family)